jgi:hypothetical protein
MSGWLSGPERGPAVVRVEWTTPTCSGPAPGGREAGAGTEPVQAPPSLSVAVATVQLGAPKIEISASGADHSGVRQAMMPMHVELMLCIPLINLKTPSGGAFFLAKRRRL